VGESPVAGRQNAMSEADLLHRSGWSIGITAFHATAGAVVWVVSGSNGENLIRAEGLTAVAARRAALGQARAVGMVRGWRVSEPGPG
jgi:hypothetical protein